MDLSSRVKDISNASVRMYQVQEECIQEATETRLNICLLCSLVIQFVTEGFIG